MVIEYFDQIAKSFDLICLCIHITFDSVAVYDTKTLTQDS